MLDLGAETLKVIEALRIKDPKIMVKNRLQTLFHLAYFYRVSISFSIRKSKSCVSRIRLCFYYFVNSGTFVTHFIIASSFWNEYPVPPTVCSTISPIE